MSEVDYGGVLFIGSLHTHTCRSPSPKVTHDTNEQSIERTSVTIVHRRCAGNTRPNRENVVTTIVMESMW